MTRQKVKRPDLIPGDVTLKRRSLAIFIDETGNEDFKSPGAFFAIGGVAGFAPELMRAEQQWRAMKGRSFGGPDEPLHASGRKLSRKQIDEISALFANSRLMRFAYVVKRPSVMPRSLNALHLLQGKLAEDLGRAVGEMATLPDEIAISIEMSERLLPKILSAFPLVSLSVDGTIIPIVGMFTPKIPPQPLLEMADQVAWRVQRQYREYSPQNSLMPEFATVFPRGAPHARYRELTIASMSGGSDPEWRIDFDESGKLSISRRGGGTTAS